LVYVVRDLPGIEAFRVVQESRHRTRVLLVRGLAFQTSSVQAIIEGFKRRLGAAVDVEVEFVGELPSERSGKFRYVVSNVQSAVASIEPQ